MNDNLIEWEGPKHLQATDLINDLMIILSNMAKRGFDIYDDNGDPIYYPEYWARQCAKALGVKKIP